MAVMAKRRVKTALECQTYCALTPGAINFAWRASGSHCFCMKVKPRLTYCRAKMGFTSGPVTC